MKCSSLFSKRWTLSVVLAGLCTLTMLASGCATKGQTGALVGSGVGALAGQAIGGNTASTLIGAGIGAGIGFIVGNEMDKKEATEMSQQTASANYAHTEDTQPLAGTKWKLTSLNPPDVTPEYTSMLVEFRQNGFVVTTTTRPDGSVETAEENYRVVGDTLIVNRPGYLINARYRITGDEMIVSAQDFSAVLQRLP
jgi:hypothetical protein